MRDIGIEITHLAAFGITPREIEKQLGFRPYTIHIKYHHALMEGYSIRQAQSEEKEKKEKEKNNEPNK